MKLVTLAATLAAATAVASCFQQDGSTSYVADDFFLSRQLQVLTLLKHLNEPLPTNVQDVEDLLVSSRYDPKTNGHDFTDPKKMETFVRELESGRFLEREAIFSLFDANHRQQMKLFFEALMSAKKWESFFGLAIYARDKMNHRQFLYAFSTALVHRPDCRGLRLPPAYEVIPQMFLTTDVVRQAYQAKMQGKPTVIPMKFTGSKLNPEQRVAYFGEDIGLNSHHAHWHMDFPFWFSDRKDRAGELFFWMHHQLLARFDAERLSNHLPPVEPLQWNAPIVEGFAPGAAYPGGQEFPVRPDNMYFQDLPQRTVDEMVEFESRIRDAIDIGFIYDNGVMHYLNDTKGIDILGDLVESSTNSKNSRFYGSLHNDAHLLLSRVTDSKGKYGTPFGVMEHFETATRDPAFFRLHKHIDSIFKAHKDRLMPYEHEEVSFPGVTVNALKVVGESKASDPNVLVTYFDESYIDLGNAVMGKPVEIRAVVSRLNHEPFKMVATVTSEKDVFAIARVFLVPAMSWFGEEIPLDEARWSMIEVDRFPVELKAGTHVITRRSVDTSVTGSEPLSYPELMKQTKEALGRMPMSRRERPTQVEVQPLHRHCGLPHRLLLPKGSVDGMKFKVYFMLTDGEKDLVHKNHSWKKEKIPSLSYCGVLDGAYPDARPMGFPFDRPINNPESFLHGNAKVIDVTIKNVSH